jgi:hypothetical protein
MKPQALAGDIPGMGAAVYSHSFPHGSGRLIAHCAALDIEDRLPAADRLQRLIGADLTRLLLVALAGDHRMDSRRLAA